MTAIPSREVTTSQIASVGFSFYSDEEIRKLSVKRITSPLAHDNLKNAIPDGLYDPAMGPLEQLDSCATCGLKYRACPGHFGHVELAVPVYNPLVFGTLYKLLRCTCLHCFMLKMDAKEVERYEQRLRLLHEGRLVEAAALATSLTNAVRKATDNLLDEEGEEKLKLQGGSISTEEPEQQPRLHKKGGHGGSPATVHTLEAARDAALDLFRRMPANCQNCGAHNPTIKKEGASKIFQKPLDAKKLAANQMKGISISSALVGVAHSSEEAEALEAQVAEHMEQQALKRSKTAEDKEQAFMDAGKLNDKKGCVKADPAGTMSAAAEGPGNKPRYMTPAEVREVMRRMWSKNMAVLKQLYQLDQNLDRSSKRARFAPGLGKLGGGGFENAYRMFFIQTIAVPPNSVRPMSKSGDIMFEHPQNTALTQIINYNLDIVSMSEQSKEPREAATATSPGVIGPQVDLARSLRLWLSLQGSVNTLFDSSTAEGSAANNNNGIRQILEKKEGLFRKNMMGKRVNFACRSVISPDPYLGSGEIGVPPYFAVRLSVPERVTPYNVKELHDMVVRGPYEHPGANAVEDENGRLLNLTQLSKQRREAVAKQLLSKQGTVLTGPGTARGSTNKIVYRHLRDGDIMLTNRQPTLHKPGLMAHRARVLKGERTIRMHYANCATFNADFDGDEINLHLPQDLHARAEGYEIVHADQQYIVPTDGKPIRGLIQDHVVAGVLLTKRDTFLTRAEFTQLVYSAVCPTRTGFVDNVNISIPPPAVIKPRPLWTGKQVLTAVLARLTLGKAPITLQAACKTGEKYWGKGNGEETLLFHKGELITGTMDKLQYGKFGLVHAVQELYGNRAAGELLSALSRLWTQYLQMHGFTCGISDLLLQLPTEGKRARMNAQAEARALAASADYVGIDAAGIASIEDSSAPALVKKEKEVQAALSERYRSSKATGAVHDRRTTSALQPLSSEVVDMCLPGGLVKPFPLNCLSLMTVTGAKGSNVNFSQISCLLGQQELEGRRVPRMASGKTLPCFGPYEGGARSGGYVSDRFLTGLRPQEYYFHCMAGREGLVDTTVKTSRSGYLQRCLVKNLESLRVHYDHTVRDNCDGSVVQFQYGEDGIDVLNNSFLREFGFLARNVARLTQQQLPGPAKQASQVAGLAAMEKSAAKAVKKRQKLLSKKERGKKVSEQSQELPVMAVYPPTLLGVTSESYQDALGKFVRANPEGHLKAMHGKKRHSEGEVKEEDAPGSLAPEEFQMLMDLRYMRALAAPGEAVGVIAAQSVGEPSTQMTLNTFHMAGRGEANVTLGIPRLRELFMTAAQSIKTPVMTMPLLPGKTKADAELLANTLRRIRLAEVLEGISIEELIAIASPNSVEAVSREYTLRLRFYPEAKFPKEANLSFQQVAETFKTDFMTRLGVAVRNELKKAAGGAKIGSVNLSRVEEEGPPAAPTEGEGEGATGRKRKSLKEDEDENAEDDEENEEGKLRFQGGRGEKGAMYDQGDEEDKAIAAAERQRAEGQEELPEEMTPEVTPAPIDAGEQQDEPSPATSRRTTLETMNAVDAASHTCTATITMPLSTPKLLMLEIAERVAATTMVRHTPGIEKCYVVEGQRDPAKPDQVPPPSVQTDGINFEGAWSNDDTVDINRLTTNDVGSILHTYGVEAARATIMREVSSVFGAYGIAVDPRHLGLISDFMTHQGGYRACSRMGIESSKSTFLKITFETAAHFLTDATLRGAADDLHSPAAKIVMGGVVDLGTGSFELLQQLDTKLF